MFRKPWPVLLLVAALLMPTAAAAQDADAPEAAIEQTHQRLEEVNAQLDLMRASDVDLQRESDRLENQVKLHDERAALAQLHLAEVEASIGGIETDLREAERLAERRKALLRERAVAAYVRPGTESMSVVLTSDDYDQAHRRATMLAEVAEHDADVLRGKREAEAALQDVKTRYEGALAEAARLRQESADELAAAQQARDSHAEVQTALETRIAEFQAEADELAAYEGQLVSLITSRSQPPESSTTPTTAAPTTTATPGSTVPGQPPTTRPPTTVPPTTTTTTGGGGFTFMWPAAGPVTSPYGMRWGRMHQGIDIGAGMGAPIIAGASGTVIFAGTMDGYGNVVLIDHLNGLVTVYAHQSSIAVGNGARVSGGQVIGYVGSTGNSTGPHLHFETRKGGYAVDPMQYLR